MKSEDYFCFLMSIFIIVYIIILMIVPAYELNKYEETYIEDICPQNNMLNVTESKYMCYNESNNKLYDAIVIDNKTRLIERYDFP